MRYCSRMGAITAPQGERDSLPTATWRSLKSAVTYLQSKELPAHVSAHNLPLGRDAAEQVVRSLRALGLVSGDTPTLALRRLVKDGRHVATVFDDRYPDLTGAIRSSAPADDVHGLLERLPGSAETRRRFRGLLLGALEDDGADVSLYRWQRQQPRSSRAPVVASLQEELIKEEATVYLDALREALRHGDDSRAEWISAQLRALRIEG